jgi:hypothetical protein
VGPGRDSPQLRVATLGPQQGLTPSHGWVRNRHVPREGDILQDINSEPGPPWEGTGPLDIQSGPPSWSKTRPGPPCVLTGPLEWDPDPHMGSGPPTVGSQDLT